MAVTNAAPPAYEYPFATSPDILRAHEKDAYITSKLSTEASSILRSIFGARFAHRHSTATTHLTELLYLCLTTLLGNRTLGEEYCDIIQIESDTLSLPSLVRRVGYILTAVFSPWLLAQLLPALRNRLRRKLEHNLARVAKHKPPNRQPLLSTKLQAYILTHLGTLTSPSPVLLLHLSIFYFTGTYYHLSKRLLALRYIFTRKLKPSEERVGYEVLGVLLVLQIALQSSLHIRQTYLEHRSVTSSHDTATATSSVVGALLPSAAVVAPGVEMPFSGPTDPNAVLESTALTPYTSSSLSSVTSTPVLDSPRYNLLSPQSFAWIPGGTGQRKCTLCLEPFKDPSVTTCGHVFCWTCVQDWVREKAECPLCRQKVLGQKVLPLRE